MPSSLFVWSLTNVFLFSVPCFLLADGPNVDDVQRSIVQVKAPIGGGKMHTGTGIIASYDPATETAIVYTNAHVVRGARQVFCCSWRDNKPAQCGQAEVVSRSRNLGLKDFAILRCTIPRHLEPVACEFSDTKPAPADCVYGVGFPGGRGLCVYAGVVIPTEGKGLITFNPSILGGVSGGPLFDSNGRVVGVCSLTFDNSGNSGAYPIRDWR